MRRPAPNTIKYTNCTCRILGRRNRHAGTTPSSATVRLLFTLVFTANAHIVISNVMRRPALNTIKYTNFTCRTVSRRNRYAGTTPSSATSLSATPSFVALSSATVWGLFTLVFTANAHIVIPNVMRRPALNTIKYTNFTCRTVGRRNQHAGMMLAPATPLSATSLSATPSFVALSSATVWGLSALVFTANAHIVIPNVMRRPAPNTIKYTNCTCRTVGRRNRRAGTTPSSATVRSLFTLRRSYRRRHRLVSFSSKSFRFGDVAAFLIRSPRSVTDEYWYVASAAQLRAAEWRAGQLRYTLQIALNTTPEQLTQYLNYNEKGNDTPRRADPTPPARNR